MPGPVPPGARRIVITEESGEEVTYIEEAVVRKWIRDGLSTVRHRFAATLLLVGALAALGIYLAQDARSDSERGLAEEGARATYASCTDRAEARFSTASGFDTLRRLAVPVDQAKTPEARNRVKAFLDATQPAIDAQLSDAVRHSVVTSGSDPEHPDRERGEINEAVLRPLRAEVRRNCLRAAARFDVDLGKLGLGVRSQRSSSP